MPGHSAKSQEKQDEPLAVANDHQGSAAVQFVDNRPQAQQVRQLQDLANEHSRKNATRIIDNRPGVAQLMKVENHTTVGPASISDKGGLVTPLKAANHELYFKDDSYLNEMNHRGGAGNNSVIKFKKGGKQDIKGASYNSAIVEDTSLSEKKMVELKGELKEHRNRQLAVTEKQLSEKYSSVEKRKHLQRSLQKITESLELLKKVMMLDAAEGHQEQIRGLSSYIIKLQELLSASGHTAKDFLQLQEEMNYHFAFDKDLAKRHAFTPMILLINSLKAMEFYPVDLPVEVVLLQKANFLEENLRALEQLDPASNEATMIYRSCDTIASTLLGNKINLDTSQIILHFFNGGAFHYATRIVTDGDDWVTMEGFAVGTKMESEIIGDQKGQEVFESMMNRMENTWQFNMYGAVKQKGELPVDEKNKFFEEYTRFRYFLKGKKPGGGTIDSRKNYRTRELNLLTHIGGVNFEAKDLKPLIDRGLVDEKGYIVSNQYFEESVESLTHLVCEHKKWTTPTLKEHVRQMIANSQEKGKASLPADKKVFGNSSNYLNHLRGLASMAGKEKGFEEFEDQSGRDSENEKLSIDELHAKHLETFRSIFMGEK